MYLFIHLLFNSFFYLVLYFDVLRQNNKVIMFRVLCVCGWGGGVGESVVAAPPARGVTPTAAPLNPNSVFR